MFLVFLGIPAFRFTCHYFHWSCTCIFQRWNLVYKLCSCSHWKGSTWLFRMIISPNLRKLESVNVLNIKKYISILNTVYKSFHSFYAPQYLTKHFTLNKFGGHCVIILTWKIYCLPSMKLEQKVWEKGNY